VHEANPANQALRHLVVFIDFLNDCHVTFAVAYLNQLWQFGMNHASVPAAREGANEEEASTVAAARGASGRSVNIGERGPLAPLAPL
jgi:hypothetical protein